MQQQPPGPYYARCVGQTQRAIQSLEHERRRLVRVAEHDLINLELAEAGRDDEVLAARAVEVVAAAGLHRDELIRLTVEILVLQDRLHYYRHLEALYADGDPGRPS